MPIVAGYFSFLFGMERRECGEIGSGFENICTPAKISF
jgi:hypothetical protein